jgi:hypothetical protein
MLLCTGLSRAGDSPPLDLRGASIPVQPEHAWQRFGGDLVRGFYNMYQPCVVEVPGSEYPYRMWFFGWAAGESNPDVPGSDAIFHARSRDLEHWEIYAGEGGWDPGMSPEHWRPVVTASDTYHDSCHNGDPSVVYRDGRFYMAYSASSPPGHREGPDLGEAVMLCSIMGATSDDGIHWTKTAQPLLIESEAAQAAHDISDHHVNFLRPSLHWQDGRWRMWFDYLPRGLRSVSMGCAENTDAFDAPGGFRPVHDLDRPLIISWVNPDVVRHEGRYYAFGDPPGFPGRTGWQARAVCEAVSDNGMDWRVVGFITPDADAAACHVPQALVAERDGLPWLFLFYATQRGGTETFGVYDFRYDRIRARRRPLVNPSTDLPDEPARSGAVPPREAP